MSSKPKVSDKDKSAKGTEADAQLSCEGKKDLFKSTLLLHGLACCHVLVGKVNSFLIDA